VAGCRKGGGIPPISGVKMNNKKNFFTFLAVMIVVIALLSIMFFVKPASGRVLQTNPVYTIQRAVNESGKADTVLLDAGEYHESVTVRTDVTIASDFIFIGDTTVIHSTVIMPGTVFRDTTSCFIVIGARFNLVGVTIENGRASNGAGVFSDHAEVIIRNVRFIHCIADLWGGAIFSDESSLTVIGCTFQDNRSQLEAGGIYCTDGDMNLRSSRFTECSGNVGGVFLGWSNGTIADCSFEECSSTDGLNPNDLFLVSGNYIVTRNVFSYNSSLTTSVLAEDDGDHTIIFTENTVRNNQVSESVGSVYLHRCRGMIQRNMFRNNSGENGGSLVLDGCPDIRVRHNSFIQNRCYNESWGSAISLLSNNTLVLDSNSIHGNFGKVIDTENLLIATNNWWGSSSGPYPHGTGDTISLDDNISYQPFLVNPADTLPMQSPKPRPVPYKTWNLLDPYPNPFNSEIKITVAGRTFSDFMLGVYNNLGQIVDSSAQGEYPFGFIIIYAPKSLSTGIYFVVAKSKNYKQIKKILYIK